MGLFSSIGRIVKKAVAVAAPLAAVAASFTPVGAAANLVAGATGQPSLFQRFLTGFGSGAGAPLPQAQAPAPAPPQFCPAPQFIAPQPAPVRRGFGFSVFRPRQAFPQQAISPGFVRPTFRAFQPIFNPSGRLQNTANGMFQFQRAPGLSRFQSSFAGFGGKFTRFGSFNRRVTPPQRAALFPPTPRPSGRGLNTAAAVVGVKPFFPIQAAQGLPSRASFASGIVLKRLQQPAAAEGRGAAVAVQSQPSTRSFSSFLRRSRRRRRA